MACSRSFVSKLLELDFPIIRTRTTTEKNVTFIPQNLLTHAINRRWLLGYESEIQEITDDGKDAVEENYFD
jgi:hypothetical protein